MGLGGGEGVRAESWRGKIVLSFLSRPGPDGNATSKKADDRNPF
jgi:hypothetical protein